MKNFNRDNNCLRNILFSVAANFLLVVLLFKLNIYGCTIGCAAGEIPDPSNPNKMMTFTQDSRPLLWKTNNGDLKKEKRAYYVDRSESGYNYNYIVITRPKEEINEPKGYVIGLNEKGLSIVYAENKSLRRPVSIPGKFSPKPDDGSGFYGLQKSIIGSCQTVQEARSFVEQNLSTFSRASGNYSVIDAEGQTFSFELTHKDCRSYEILDDARASQQIDRFLKDTKIEHGLTGFIVRGNILHWQQGSKDKETGKGRYLASAYNVLGMVYDNASSSRLSPINLLQGDGFTTDNGYEILRYGAGKETSKDDNRPLRTIACDTTNAGLIVHGVKKGEDPRFATLWAILGHPNYGIAVPMWAAVSEIPEVLNRNDSNMYQCSQSLAEIASKIYHRKKEYREFELTIQEAVFPMERQIYDMVSNELLPEWRNKGFNDSVRKEMTRFETQTAKDAYNVLNWFNVNCTKKDPIPGVINEIPEVSISYENIGNLKKKFKVLISDENSDSSEIIWNFGDSSSEVTGQTEILHTFPASGNFLVSCTVTDSENMSNTDWLRVRIGDDLF